MIDGFLMCSFLPPKQLGVVKLNFESDSLIYLSMLRKVTKEVSDEKSKTKCIICSNIFLSTFGLFLIKIHKPC